MNGTNIELNDNNIEVIEHIEETNTNEEEIDKYTYFMTLFINLLGIFGSLYGFLFALALMGDSFKVLGGRTAGDLFKNIDNPIAGLMVGIIVTVFYKSFFFLILKILFILIINTI